VSSSDRECCERHTEHARSAEGLLGRHFDAEGRSYWDWCDTEMGEWVECLSHRRVHHTGWCSVGHSNKRPARDPSTASEVPERSEGRCG
jgi:hypothetical protein